MRDELLREAGIMARDKAQDPNNRRGDEDVGAAASRIFLEILDRSTELRRVAWRMLAERSVTTAGAQRQLSA